MGGRKGRSGASGGEDREGSGGRREVHSRWLSIIPGDDGTCQVTGRLTPEIGLVLLRALDAAEEALHPASVHDEGVAGGSAEPPSPREMARRRADAFALVAERYLALVREEEGRPRP